MSTKYRYLQLLTAFNLLLMVSSRLGPYHVAVLDTNDSLLHGDSADSEVEADCTKCYKALAIELLKNPTNYFNLQMAFFPPNDTSPDFVIVRYSYEGDSENGALTPNHSAVWFWSSAAYFFYNPIRIFQFTSFVFSIPLLQQCTLTLHLPANCSNASDTFMKLLTQRVSLTLSLLKIIYH